MSLSPAKVIAVFAGLACFAQAGPAMARSLYNCGGGGVPVMSITVERDAGRGQLRWNGRDIRLAPETGGKWVSRDQEVEAQFFTERYPHSVMGDKPPVLMLGSEQFGCTLAQDGHGETAAVANDGGRGLDARGLSLGGNLRSGPGVQFSQIASVHEHARLTILRNAGVAYDGYDWFEVRLERDGTQGFQWGGIMCSNTPVKGVYQVCPSVSGETPSAPTGRWMAFAIGSDGRFGHGAAPTRSQAEAFALKFCGASDCQIDNVTQRRCQALSQADGGNWYGAASNKKMAGDMAVGACTSATGRACPLTYSHCY